MTVPASWEIREISENFHRLHEFPNDQNNRIRLNPGYAVGVLLGRIRELEDELAREREKAAPVTADDGVDYEPAACRCHAVMSPPCSPCEDDTVVEAEPLVAVTYGVPPNEFVTLEEPAFTAAKRGIIDPARFIVPPDYDENRKNDDL